MYGRREYKEITIVVPENLFRDLPEKIEYKDIPYGRMEKAWRLLVRSMVSALDNGKNAKIYSDLRKQYAEKKKKVSSLQTENKQLHYNIKVIKDSINKFELKIDGCSAITQQIKENERRIETLQRRMESIRNKVPKYMWGNIYWW